MKRTSIALAVLSALLLLPTLTACVPEDVALQEREVTLTSDLQITPVQAEIQSQRAEATSIWQALNQLELTPSQREQLTALMETEYPLWEGSPVPTIGIDQVDNTLARHQHKLLYGEQPTSIGVAIVDDTLELAEESQLAQSEVTIDYTVLDSIGSRVVDETLDRYEHELRYGDHPTSIGLAVVGNGLVPEDATHWAQRSNRFHEHLSELLTEQQLTMYEQYRLQR